MKKRSLSFAETNEARLVFGPGLDLEEVRVLENAAGPLLVGRLAAALRQRPPPPAHAVTLGTTIYFSRALSIPREDETPRGFQDMAWLVHELAHVWQYRHMGWRYLPKALEAFLRLGPLAYDYGGAPGLITAGREGRRLADFNPEQQGEIARDYYLRLKAHLEVGPWERFVAELRSL
ncbi:MAG: DUF4157 domain-containing protein [Anaerolineales bacterium]